MPREGSFSERGGERERAPFCAQQRWTRSKSLSRLSLALLATLPPLLALHLSLLLLLLLLLPSSPLASAHPTQSPLPPIQRTNNNNPRTVTSIPTLLPSNMLQTIHVVPFQNLVPIYSSIRSARASLERSNSASTPPGARKLPSSSSKDITSNLQFACQRSSERSRFSEFVILSFCLSGHSSV
jgi:hypothetical protein